MKVLLSGGGTGGHINPGLAIARYIKEKQPDTEFLFVGTHKGLEGELVPKAGFPITFIEVEGFRRKLSVQTLGTVKKMFRGYGQSKKILKEFRPDIVIGTGGYVCGPVLYAACRKGYKTLVHEQNVIPGVTVKLLSRMVDGVLTSFPETSQYIKGNLILTGNPISPDLLTCSREQSRRKLGVDGRPLLLAYGGSLGARRINETICEMIRLTAGEGRYQLLFATGQREYDKVMEEMKGQEYPNVQIKPYLYNMAECMAAADLVIARSGAMTVSELAAVGKPAILIPSPNVAHNHQEYNARALEQKGAAMVLTEDQLTVQRLWEYVSGFLNDSQKQKDMAEHSRIAGIRDATETIYQTVLSLTAK
ncbi:MAG: undecaprenyldiphospho-muramoylpentapeptide beta-N-acetylglucosaminyltransferase [Clostridia bacterium]|nr:undecaprenyldiphospho-muramoylpentapeptide beta-N-acetylglucosaminyltransferase [Clostridia bacterium]